MNARFEKLFKVHVEHKYFGDFRFNGCRIIPTEESESLFATYGLLYRSEPAGFIVYFETTFEGNNRDRESLLKEIITLQFSFQIIDPSFYQYTGNLPDKLVKRIFWFSNFDEKQQVLRQSNLLHVSEFVAETEVRPSPDSLNYFGYIEIQFDVHLKEDLYIRFLNKSTYWRYLIVNKHLQKFEKLAILDQANQQLFSGPEIVELPDGTKAIAFTSAEPIALTQQSDKHFQLVENYDEMTNHFERKLIPRLPDPSLVTDEKFSECIIYL